MFFLVLFILDKAPLNRFLATHADRQGVDISVTVCFCVRAFVYTVKDFSGEDKASFVKFCTVVRQYSGLGISHFGGTFLPKSPKLDESARAHRNVLKNTLVSFTDSECTGHDWARCSGMWT